MINIKKIFIITIISLFYLTKSNAEIKDYLFATVGNKAITHSDIVREIKIILILSGKSFSEEMREELESVAIRSTVERSIKEIEVEKYESLKANETDINNELNRLAENINMDLDTLKSIFIANGIDFENVINQTRTEFLWNGLIFEIYKNRLSINIDEIDEQLKLIELKKEINEYLLSEILIKSVPKEEMESKIEDIKNKIKTEGFEKVALNLSISETSPKNGDMGWVSENAISENLKSKIINTSPGNVTEPILLPVGILFLKVRDKRKIEKNTNLEEVKDKLVKNEKVKILKMHSLSHFDKLKRSISIKYY